MTCIWIALSLWGYAETSVFWLHISSLLLIVYFSSCYIPRIFSTVSLMLWCYLANAFIQSCGHSGEAWRDPSGGWGHWKRPREIGNRTGGPHCSPCCDCFGGGELWLNPHRQLLILWLNSSSFQLLLSLPTTTARCQRLVCLLVNHDGWLH